MNDRRLVTRRGFLVGGAVLVAGGAGGVLGWQSIHDRARSVPPPVPRAPVLEAQLAREQALLARFTATTTPPAALGDQLVWLRADHAAHVEALRAVLAGLGVPLSTSSSPTVVGSSSPPLPFASPADLLAEEVRAARSATAASQQLTGTAAATLASLSACESVHAALLG